MSQWASNGGVAVIVGAGVLAQCQTSPAAPTMIRGAVTGTGIEVSWAPARGEKPASYMLHVGSSPGSSGCRGAEPKRRHSELQHAL